MQFVATEIYQQLFENAHRKMASADSRPDPDQSPAVHSPDKQ